MTTRTEIMESLPVTTPKNPPTIRATCGKYAGYQAHRKAGELICDDCRDARNAWERGRRAARTTAADRAALTSDEISEILAALGTGELAVTVESLIARRLLRYTS